VPICNDSSQVSWWVRGPVDRLGKTGSHVLQHALVLQRVV
jgi:hypothetical protein